MLKVEQTNLENEGINPESAPAGYQHHDALWFGENEHNSYRELARTIVEVAFPYAINILEFLFIKLGWFNIKSY